MSSKKAPKKDSKEKKAKGEKSEVKEKKTKEESKEEKPTITETNNNDPVPSSSSSTKAFNPLPGEIYSDRILSFYDETAGIAIPNSETEHHRKLGNVVVSLVDAYSTRYERLRTQLTSKLLPRREYLLQIFRKLKENIEEINEKGRLIERETLNDAERIIDRLKGKISKRQSSIQHELIHIEEELSNIERIIKRVERANLPAALDDPKTALLNPLGLQSTGIHLTSVNPASAPVAGYRLPKATLMVEVIQEYGELNSLINQASSRQINVNVDFPTDDFPRETSDRLEILSKCDRFSHALNVKDQLLWLALQDKERLHSELQEHKKLAQDYAIEMAKWAEVTHQYKNQAAVLSNEKMDLERRNYELQQILKSHNIYFE